MKLLFVALVALLLVGSVAAIEKYPSFWQTFKPYKSSRCVLKELKYADGTVYHTTYGITGRRSDGSEVCYIPTFGAKGRVRSGARLNSSVVA